MAKKRYSITLILQTAKTVDSSFDWMDYSEAFMRAEEALKKYKDAWGILLHSDHQTAIVLTRKHFPKLFKIKS
jgi:hypothetical protein